MPPRLECETDNASSATNAPTANLLDEAINDAYFKKFDGFSGWFRSTYKPSSNRDTAALPGLTVGDSASISDYVLVPRNGTEHKAYHKAYEASVSVAAGNSGGSGFFINKDGAFITASHVIPYGRSYVRITTSDGRDFEASLVSRDTNNDVALLKVAPDAKPRNFSYLKLNTNSAFGEKLAAVGHPRNWPNTYISMGPTSETPFDSKEVERWKDRKPMILMRAHVQGGNSGGAVIDGCGNVRGVAIAGSPNGDLALAMPSNAIEELVRWTNKNANGELEKEQSFQMASWERGSGGVGKRPWQPAMQKIGLDVVGKVPSIHDNVSKKPNTVKTPNPRELDQPKN